MRTMVQWGLAALLLAAVPAAADTMPTPYAIATKGTFTNGQASRGWRDSGGAVHVFPTTAAFTAFAEAMAQYVDALDTALAVGQGGGAWVAPAQHMTIA